MRNIFLSILLGAHVGCALAIDYYVSNIGSENANGRFPDRSMTDFSNSPFKYLKNLGEIKFGPGDSIYLACGQTFDGPLIINIEGATDDPVSFSRYGKCDGENNPVIDGRVKMIGLEESGLHVRNFDAEVVQLFSGNTPVGAARYPVDGYLIVPENFEKSKLKIPLIGKLISSDLNQSKIHARSEEWFIEERLYDAARERMVNELEYPLRPKAGFYLTGKAWMISPASPWTYDLEKKSLFLNNFKKMDEISIVFSGPLLNFEGRGSLRLNNIELMASGGDAIKVHLNKANVFINNVHINYAAANGISILGADKALIDNVVIRDVRNDGIFFAEVSDAVVVNSQVINAGMYLGPSVSLAAINAHRTQKSTISNNFIYKSAYIGIRVSGGASVTGNSLKSTCMYLSDCAAIYTWRRNAMDVREYSVIENNKISGVKGDTTVKLGVNDYFAGIYLDEFSNNIRVAENSIIDAVQGIYLHNAFSNLIENNYVCRTPVFMIDAAEIAQRDLGGRYVDNIKRNNVSCQTR